MAKNATFLTDVTTGDKYCVQGGLLVNQSSPPVPVVTDDTVAVKKATVTLTDAQIKTLPTTAVEIVPAPGAGKRIQIVKGWIDIDTTAGAYTVPTDASWMLHIGTDEATGFIDAEELNGDVGRYTAEFPPYVKPNTDDFPNHLTALLRGMDGFIDAPVYILDTWNGVADYTGGHANNTMDVSVVYTIVDV